MVKQTIWYQGTAIGAVYGVDTCGGLPLWVFESETWQLGGIPFTARVHADNFVTAARRGAALFHEVIGTKFSDAADWEGRELFEWHDFSEPDGGDSYRVRKVAK